MKILIINLTRMGDIIQTLPLCAALKKKHAPAKVDFLCFRSFAEVLSYAQGIDEIITIDDTVVFDKSNYANAYLEIKKVHETLKAENYDLVVNPAVSLESSLWGFLLPVPTYCGMRVNAAREQVIASEFTAYHLANEHNLGDHSLNLVDIFAGVGDTFVGYDEYLLLTPEEIRQTANNFFLGIPKLPTVGFHLGASRSNKTWEVENFRSVMLDLLQNRACNIVLFGGYKESELSSYFADFPTERFFNLIGKLALPELIAYIDRVDLFVTNDTGPMHIAAAQKKKIINLSLGPVSMWETGPYTADCLVAKAKIACHPCSFSYVCPHLDCHKLLDVAAVEKLIACFLDNEEIPQDTKTVHFFKGQKDIFGFQHYVPAQKREITADEYFFEAKRAVWSITLKPDLTKTDVVKSYLAYLKEHYRLSCQTNSSLTSLLQELSSGAEKIANDFKKLSEMSPDDKKTIDKIRTLYNAIKLDKESLFILAKTEKNIYDLFLYAGFRESAVETPLFSVQARRYSEIYTTLELQLKLLTRFFKEL